LKFTNTLKPQQYAIYKMPEQKSEKSLMAGHAPATIVGGMRVSTPKVHHPKEAPANGNNANGKDKDVNNSSQDERASTDDSSNTSASDTAVVQPSNNHTILVDGNSIRIEDAFPTEAVKVFHEKPQPTHDKTHFKPMHQINQPRKF